MTSPVSLVPNLAIAATREEIADRLERVAEDLRANRYGDITRAVVVLQQDTEGVFVRGYGRPMTGNEMVGFLTYAINDIVTGNDLQTE